MGLFARRTRHAHATHTHHSTSNNQSRQQAMQRACLEVIEQRLFAGNLLIPAAGGILSALDAGQVISAAPVAPAPNQATPDTQPIADGPALRLSTEPQPLAADAQASDGEHSTDSSFPSDLFTTTSTGIALASTSSPADTSAPEAPLGAAAGQEDLSDASSAVPLPDLPDSDLLGDPAPWTSVTAGTGAADAADAGGSMLLELAGLGAWEQLPQLDDGDYGNWPPLLLEDGDPLAVPSALRAQPVSSTEITLSWQDEADGESGYEIDFSTDSHFDGYYAPVYRRTTGAFSATPGSPTGPSLRIYNLDAATEYHIRIRTVAGGGSPWTSLTATTLATHVYSLPPSPMPTCATAPMRTTTTEAWAGP